MIIDNIQNAEKYDFISDDFQKAINFLRDYKKESLPEGKYKITEDAVAIVKRYETKDVVDCGYEAHRDCFDVQCIVSGEECIGWAPRSKMNEISYNEKSDQYALEGNGSLYPIHAGEMIIFFPDEAHMPCVAYKNNAPVEKVIIKIKKKELV